MTINALMIAIIGFTLFISGCIDKKTDIANESINPDKNNSIVAIDNRTTPEQAENNSKSIDNSLSINIVLEKPPEEVIGGE